MKKYLCCITAFLIAVGTMYFMETSHADSFELAYGVCEKLDFEDLSKLSGFTGSFDVQNGVFRSDGNALKVSQAKYTFSDKALAGAFSLKFNLFISDIQDSCSISVNSNVIKFTDSNDKIFVISDEAVIAELEYGLWYEAEFSFNALNGLKLKLLKDGRLVAEKSFGVSESFLFSDISFVSDSEMYIDNLELLRPLISNGADPVIYKNGEYIVAEASPVKYDNKENMLVLAAFGEDNNLISSCVSCGKDNAPMQTYMSFDKNAKTYKAFMWCSNLFPQGDVFAADKDSEYISQINLKSSFEMNLLDKKLYIKSADLPEADSFKIVLCGDEEEAKTFTKEEISGGTAYFDMSDKEIGEYTVLVSSLHEIYEIPLFQKSFTFRDNVPENDTYVFKMGYPYYFHNDEKCFFAENKTYSPKFENGEMFVDKITLKNLFALEPSGDDSLFAVGNVMKELGYNTYFDECGIYVVSLDSKWTDDGIGESEVIFTEGFDGNNVNMSIQYWGGSGVSLKYGKTSEEAKSGNYSYSINAVPSSFIGLKVHFEDFDQGDDVQKYKFTFWAKASDDFSGNTLGGLAIFFKNNGWTPHFPSFGYPTNEWREYSFVMDRTKFIDQDSMTLAVKMSNPDSSSYSGKLFIDDITVTKIKNGSDTLKNYALECAELFEENYVAFEDFDGQNSSESWSFGNWGAGNQQFIYGTKVFDSDFGKTAYLGSVSKPFVGFRGPTIMLDENAKTYSMTADIYVTDDYNNRVGFAFLMNGVKLVKASPIGNYIKKGQWNRVTGYFDTDDVLNGEYTSFVPVVFTSTAAATEVSGRVYIDNIAVSINGEVSENIIADIKNQSFASWHVLGDDVVYKTDANYLKGFDMVEGIVYNSINEEVFRKEVSVYTISTDGWTWKPDITGYFEVEFYAVRNDGSRSLIVDEYTNSYSDMPENFNLTRRSFAVVSNEAKPINERNEKLYVSSHALSDIDPKIASMLGFYGARIHWIRWGSSATVSGAHTGVGKYDWTNVDKQFKNIKNAGFGAISANIYGTPQWATPEEHRNETTNTIAGSLKYNNYAPADMKNLTDFLEAFIDRYGDDVDMIEFWNEPQKGTTAFWNDTTENFAKMLKAAYTTIKANSDITVSFPGMGDNDRYANFYDELLDIDGIQNYYDIMAYHGTYNVSERLNNIAKNKGFEPKKWQNSEGYFSNYTEFLKITDKYNQAKHFVTSYLENFKAGAEIITVFQMLNLSEEEYRVYTNEFNADTSLYGIFRKTPHVEPTFTAVAVFNLFDKIGKSFEYVGEDEFNDVRAVLFNNDGKAFVAMWSKSSSDFSMPDELGDLGGTVIDFEGNSAHGTVLDGNRIYYITEADLQKAVKVLGTDKNNVLNPAMKSPYFNAEIN